MKPISSQAPRVSICIPTYLQVDYLRDTLASVQAQDFENYELIVTDDSPDESVATLLQEFRFGSRLVYRRNSPRLGSPGNWNAAVRLARGEYIKIVHHDDCFASPEALGKFVCSMDAYPSAHFGFCASIIYDARSKRTAINRLDKEVLSRLRMRPESLFTANVIGAPSATIYRRSIELQFDEEMKWLVDIDFYIRALLANNEFVYIPEGLIVTPTNARHQVTEQCKAEGSVELFEYQRLFTKMEERLIQDSDVRAFWRHILEKYRIRKPEDFLRYGVVPPNQTAYFTALQPRHWLHAKLANRMARLVQRFRDKSFAR